jgi:hypothetical protein
MKKQLHVIPLDLLLAPMGRNQGPGVPFGLLKTTPVWVRFLRWLDQILHKVAWYWYVWIINVQMGPVPFTLFDSWEHVGLVRLMWVQDVALGICLVAIPGLQRLRFLLPIICYATAFYLFIIVRSIFF